MNTDFKTVSALMPQRARALSIPFCVVLYEAGDALCERTANNLRDCFRQIAEPLFEAIHPKPISISDLRTVIETESSPERLAESWGILEKCELEPFNPADSRGKAAPQCILLVSARYLLVGSDRELLIRELQAAHFSQFLIVFFAKLGEVPFASEENEYQEWLKSYARFDHTPVSMHLVSPTFEGGEPISATDLADSVASALTVDLLLPHPRSARILSDIEEGHSIELSTFGVKSVRFDPLQIAESFKKRAAGELLKRTVFKEVESPQFDPIQISSPIDVLNGRDAPGQKVGTGGEVGGCALGRPLVVLGRDCSVKFQGGWIPDEEQLDKLPEDEWVSVLHDSAAVLVRKLNSTISNDVEDAIKRHVQSERAYLKDRLAQAFSSDGGSRVSSSTWEEIERQLREIYPMPDSPAEYDSTVTPLDRLLSELREAVDQIPKAEQLVGRMALRFVPWLVPGVIALHYEIPYPDMILLAGGILGIWGALRVWRQWRRAKSRARSLRNRVLKQMRGGASSNLSGTIQNLVSRAGQELTEAVGAFRKAIEAAQGVLSQLAGNIDLLQSPTRSTAVQRLPSDADQMEYLFFSWWSSEPQTGGVEHEFRRMIRDHVPEILEGKETPAELGQEIEKVALAFCVGRLQTLKLWNFFQEDPLTASSTLVPEKLESALAKLQARPWIFLQNIAIRDLSSRRERTCRLIIGPRILQPKNPSPGQAASIVFDNALAVIVRVRLAELRALAQPQELSEVVSVHSTATL